MLKKTLTPGMDDAQAHRDRGGWEIPIQTLTGPMPYDWDEGGGTIVGIGYDEDPMGEEYHPVTYVGNPGNRKMHGY